MYIGAIAGGSIYSFTSPARTATSFILTQVLSLYLFISPACRLDKGIHHEFTWWGRPETTNYPISMLPAVFRSVDCIVKDRLNNPCRSC